MTLGGLFSGIGGFELAAQWAGIEPVWSNEIGHYCCKVLRKNFTHKIIEDDIRKIGKHNLQSVDIICGGFPCQPFSQAGRRKGTDDDRYLWPQMLRVIRELKPSWVVGENVAGLISMENGRTLDAILTSLEDEGYYTETFLIPACGVGAWHRRDRIWICAHAINDTDRGQGRPAGKAEGIQEINGQEGCCGEPGGTSEVFQSYVANADNTGFQEARTKQQTAGIKQCGELGYAPNANNEGLSESRQKSGKQKVSEGHGIELSSWWQAEPGVGRVVDGLPNRVDRIKALGNAIVPQVAYEIFKAILKSDSI